MTEPGDATPDPDPAPDETRGRHRRPDRPDVVPSFGSASSRRGRRRVGRRRRALGIGLVLAGFLLLAGFAWVAVTGLMARTELREARDAVGALRTHLSAGDLDAAGRDAATVRSHAGRAHDLTTGPAWALGALVPAGGEALDSVRGLAASIDRLAHTTLPALVQARRELDPATLRAADGRIDLTRIEQVAPTLAAADTQLRTELRRIDALPADTWIGAVDDARRDSLVQLDEVGGTVSSADLAAQILPRALGASGTVRYFVAFQNGAEARGTGGLPGAFGILAVTDGRPRFERFESDNALDGVRARVDLGRDFDDLYRGADPTGLYVNSNLSAHFPYAARIWTDMWQRKSGQRLDGAIALDPTALSYLLAVTGPATLDDGTRVDAGNVTTLTQSTVYAKFGDRTAARRAYLRQIAAKASEVVVNSRANAQNLLDAAGRAGTERRLLVWSALPAVEKLLARTTFAGAVTTQARPYAGLSVVNDGGDKLDYYLDRDVRWQPSGCGATRDVTATVRLANTAPAGLPASVTRRSDVRGYPIRPGDNRLLVSWYATAGAQLASVTLDGKPVGAHVGTELGHPVFTVDVEVPRASTRTVVLHLREPGSRLAPTVLRQPLARPLTVTVGAAACR